MVPTMSRDCRCPFPNMAAAKPEVYLSPVVGELEAKFQSIDFWGFSRMLGSTEVVSIMSRDCRGHFPNMAASKPEVYVFSLVGEIEAK